MRLFYFSSFFTYLSKQYTRWKCGHTLICIHYWWLLVDNTIDDLIWLNWCLIRPGNIIWWPKRLARVWKSYVAVLHVLNRLQLIKINYKYNLEKVLNSNAPIKTLCIFARVGHSRVAILGPVTDVTQNICPC